MKLYIVVINHYDYYNISTIVDFEILAEAMAVLRGMFGDSIPDAEEILVPRGEEDPLLHGAFSFWSSGYEYILYSSIKSLFQLANLEIKQLL